MLSILIIEDNEVKIKNILEKIFKLEENKINEELSIFMGCSEIIIEIQDSQLHIIITNNREDALKYIKQTDDEIRIIFEDIKIYNNKYQKIDQHYCFQIIQEINRIAQIDQIERYIYVYTKYDNLYYALMNDVTITFNNCGTITEYTQRPIKIRCAKFDKNTISEINDIIIDFLKIIRNNPFHNWEKNV